MDGNMFASLSLCPGHHCPSSAPLSLLACRPIILALSWSLSLPPSLHPAHSPYATHCLRLAWAKWLWTAGGSRHRGGAGGKEGRGGDGLCFWFGGAHILHNLSNLCNCNTAMTTMTMTMVMVMAMAIEPPDDSDKQDSTVAKQQGGRVGYKPAL